MAQHRVTTRRRHRKSDVVVLVYIKNTKQGLLETMFVYIFPQTSSGRNKYKQFVIDNHTDGHLTAALHKWQKKIKKTRVKIDWLGTNCKFSFKCFSATFIAHPTPLRIYASLTIEGCVRVSVTLCDLIISDLNIPSKCSDTELYI